MTSGLKIAFYGSSLVSAYWNGAATYYRGIVRSLHARGHHVIFLEPDAFGRQQHRDLPEDPEWAEVVVYPATDSGVRHALERAQAVDLVVKASGVGVFDELLEYEIARLRTAERMTVFWDVDAPATLERVQADSADPFLPLIPQYDLILTYGGGPPVVDAYRQLGARDCIPIYNALDPDIHHPVAADPRFAGCLAFLGNRLPDRERRVREFFFRAAHALPREKFLLGGNGWPDCADLPPNVETLGHVYTCDHNALNCTPQAVLNISRESMARFGYSPATRIFEAAGAGACLITDYWVGIEQFLEPEREILVAVDGEDVARQLRELTPLRATAIGEAARRRVTSEHTYSHRAQQLEAILDGALPPSSHARASRTDAPASQLPQALA